MAFSGFLWTRENSMRSHGRVFWCWRYLPETPAGPLMIAAGYSLKMLIESICCMDMADGSYITSKWSGNLKLTDDTPSASFSSRIISGAWPGQGISTLSVSLPKDGLVDGCDAAVMLAARGKTTMNNMRFTNTVVPYIIERYLQFLFIPDDDNELFFLR